ncbi:MAG: DinB family protein [Winogradskyella sp.]|uniref:DinB family protein n=1 Tax=Winogradskyella sp. TaxID=1883156 RepID=UPI00179C2333|nr:DinB family protein [Winogradskyella sp.]MBT8244713.1 DinB family protein [Winogradskyella sp.]NNK22793.1 DinB family protein [Winogradskyella sp.]
MLQSLIKLFNRDINAIKIELTSYKNESVIWVVDKDISNCAGNLTLHLIGNLNHFIGATLGNTDYVRQRDLEFFQKNVSVAKLIKMLEATKVEIENTLLKLKPSDLQKVYRRNPFEDYMTTEYFLLHLKSHLAYHLGQINYHRRLLD